MPFLLLLSAALPASILEPRPPLARPPRGLRRRCRRLALVASALILLLAPVVTAEPAPLRSLTPVPPAEPLVTPPAPASEPAPGGRGTDETAASGVRHRWGLEADLAQPLIPEVHIFTLKLSRTLWGRDGGPRGDALVGVYLRPSVKHDVVEKIDEYAAMVGYRQYVWRGLHAEVVSYLGYAWGTKNRIDGRDYQDVAWLLEGSVGYRLSLVEGRAGALYVAPQVGYLRGLHTNIGPRDSPDAFVTGKLLVGAQF